MQQVAALVSLAAFAAAVSPAQQLEPDSLIQALVSKVSQDSIRATIQRLQDFGTRDPQTDSNRAATRYARDRMIRYGCDTVYLHQFDTVYGYGPSVIGLKRGDVHPGIEYIICGHIDSEGSSTDSAPGAGDNASGVAAVLEACRVFAGRRFNYSVRYICFNAEEAGGLGAAWYAYEARSRGDSILGVLNFDMIGYGTEGQDSVFVAGKIGNPDCSRLLNGFCFSADAYTNLKYRRLPLVRDSFVGYDQSFFWHNGYAALLVEEVQPTPEKHGVGDTLGPYLYEHCGVNNLPLCAEVTKAAVACIATLAQVEGRPGAAETPAAEARSTSTGTTVVRGCLSLPSSQSSTHNVLLTSDGRKVLDLQPDANDVRRLSPGVYFIEEREGAGSGRTGSGEKSVVRRVLVLR